MKLSIVLLCIAASALLVSTVSAEQDVRQDILAAQGCAKGEGRDKSTTTVGCFDLPNCERSKLSAMSWVFSVAQHYCVWGGGGWLEVG